jgi:hypothetical protein
MVRACCLSVGDTLLIAHTAEWLKERFEIFGDMGYPDADDFLEKEIEDYSALHG